MIDRIVPPYVSIHYATEFQDHHLFPGEDSGLKGTVPIRRTEFATGRATARAAIQKLGLLPLGIPVGPGREPIWQSGVVGSISHCPGYCVAAVARSGDALSIGIDCELNAPLPFDVVKMVILPQEQSQIDGFDAGPIHWDRLVFSAKESVYKCWYPLMRDWLGFEEAMIVIDPDKFRFEVKLARSCQAPFGRFDRFAGRFIQCGEHLITAIVVPNG